MYDVSVAVVDKSGGDTSVDRYINATLWTVVFNDPVGDVPAIEVRLLILYTPLTNIISETPKAC